ncbi:hypothetical protein LQW54_007024 [Pestalotiopsis sp. IQ-011]
MVKPNDAVALIIGLHILLLALLSWGLVRLMHQARNPPSSTYTSTESSSYDSVIDVPPPPRAPSAGGRANVA